MTKVTKDELKAFRKQNGTEATFVWFLRRYDCSPVYIHNMWVGIISELTFRHLEELKAQEFFDMLDGLALAYQEYCAEPFNYSFT